LNKSFLCSRCLRFIQIGSEAFFSTFQDLK
jgi:hypothetical protein